MSGRLKEIKKLAAEVVVKGVVEQVASKAAVPSTVVEVAAGFEIGWQGAKFIHEKGSRRLAVKGLALALKTPQIFKSAAIDFIKTYDEAAAEYEAAKPTPVNIETARGRQRISPESRLSA